MKLEKKTDSNILKRNDKRKFTITCDEDHKCSVCCHLHLGTIPDNTPIDSCPVGYLESPIFIHISSYCRSIATAVQ